MLWQLGSGTIGGCGCHATVYGVVSEIGSIRTYDPIEPHDIGPALPPQAPSFPPFSPVNSNVLAGLPEPYYPMTAHQRLYQWPNTGVGPIRCYAEPSGWGVSKPPVEVAAGQNDWPLQPVCSVPISLQGSENLVLQPVIDVETIIPQRGNSTREFWTCYKTLPWSPTVLIREVQMTGDTRRYTIRGVTRNAAGAPLGDVGIRCIDSSRCDAGFPTNPIVAAVVSDSSGNFEFTVNPNLRYELHAYKESTDVGGISVDHLQADVTVDIYCTQPGVAPSGGGVWMPRARQVGV